MNYTKRYTATGELGGLWRDDNMFIPVSLDNTEYCEYLAWVEAGNTPIEDPDHTPEAIKERRWTDLKAERDRRKSGGVFAQGKWFHSDDASRIQQLALVLMGVTIPAFQWKTMDGSFVTMSQSLASAIFAATATLDNDLFTVAEAKRVELFASSDPATYSFEGGWPEQYVESGS